MAKFKSVTVEKDGRQRTATSPSELVAFKFDGYTVVEEPQTAAPDSSQAGGSDSKGDGDPVAAGNNKRKA